MNKTKKKYIAKRDVKSYKAELDNLFNISSNPEMVRLYIEEMGWDYLNAEIDRLNYIRKELSQSKVSDGNGRNNPLDQEYKEENE